MIASTCLLLAAAGTVPWRDDGRCGDNFTGTDGTFPAQCNPWDNGRSCCLADGFCGASSKELCSCASCVDYRIARRWREDGRCGSDIKADDGSRGAICNPLHPRNLTCCSEEGWCGAWPSYEYCRCADCVNYYRSCGCFANTPCQDPASGRCYPRNEPEEIALRPQAQQGAKLRRPEDDPKRSMRDVEMTRRFGGQNFGTTTEASIDLSRRPALLGMRCALPLVDCVAVTALLTGVVSGSPLPQVAADGHGTASSQRAPTSPDVSVHLLANATSTTEDAARASAVTAATAATAATPSAKLRLVSGERSFEGRLEVLYNGTWGSICGKGWLWGSAYVACRSLGYGGVDATSTSAVLGRSDGPVWMSHVRNAFARGCRHS